MTIIKNSLLPKPKILALDLDLTLHNVMNHYDQSVNQTLTHFGHPALSAEDLVTLGDNFTTTQALIAMFLPANKIDEASEYYMNHFLQREIPINALIPGAHELLNSVKHELKLPIIGVTNSEQHIAEKILRDLKIFSVFDHVIGVKDNSQPKPDTAMLIKALNSVGAKPDPHVWFVGDRHSDTQCAKAANCTAIRFYHKNKPLDENADLFINCHYNLYAMMKAYF